MRNTRHTANQLCAPTQTNMQRDIQTDTHTQRDRATVTARISEETM